MAEDESVGRSSTTSDKSTTENTMGKGDAASPSDVVQVKERRTDESGEIQSDEVDGSDLSASSSTSPPSKRPIV